MKNFDLQFTAWLQQKNYCINIVESSCHKAYQYLQWLKENNIKIVQANYNNLMDYVGYLQEEKQKSKVITNDHLRAISKYYEFLELPNIAYKIRIRGQKNYTPLLLKENELQQLYDNYDGYIKKSYYKTTNKLLLSLFIYQAVDIQDLERLEVKNVDLAKGMLSLPASVKRKNSRIVKLEVHQILALHEYITKYRNPKDCYLYSGENELLFAPQAEKRHRLVNQCKGINRALKKQAVVQQINYQSLPQLRQSRIGIWIKQYGLRQAQYLSGKRCVLTIERYKQLDLEDLTKQLQKFHPLR